MQSLSERMKSYEKEQISERFLNTNEQPIYARIDGKNFSKLTKNLKRPYDNNFAEIMVETTKYIVDKSDALLGYTQSDEINLAWAAKDRESQIWFDGKKHKMTSVLSALAASKFNQLLQEKIPDLYTNCLNRGVLPVFDARVIQLPDFTELSNAFLWREKDASKNAVFTTARHFFSHKSLLNMTSNEMTEKLWREKTINFYDYPEFFRRGTWVKKKNVYVELTEEEKKQIPEQHRPNKPVIRSKLQSFTIPDFKSIENKKEFFLGN